VIHLRDSDPYPWPYDGVLSPPQCALVIAGAQEAWARASLRATEVLSVITEVAAALRGGGGQVVAVHHIAPTAARPRALPPAVDSDGSGLLGDLPACDVVVRAAGANGFYGSSLDAELRARGLDRLVLCGFGAEVAVDCTLRAANDRGYECVTLIDGVAPLDEHTGRRALDSITKSGGIFGTIASAAALLEALADAVAFPTLSAVTA
jgi:biuret amidohydrolase